MSIWFDKLGKQYADAGKFSWLKAYTDKQTKQLKELFTRHANGEENRHTAEMIDYTESKTVKQALNEMEDGLSDLKTADTALNSSLSKKANISANSEGGFCAGTGAAATKGGSATGKNAVSITGCAAGQAAVTETGGSAGIGTESKKGFSGGQNSTTVNGSSSGCQAISSYGGAAGELAKTVDGFAGGQNARTSDGVAVGKNARCVTAENADSGIDAVQLGTGTNTTARTLKVYSYPMMNANGTIPLERMQLLNDQVTEQIDGIQNILTEAGILTEELRANAGLITGALNCSVIVQNAMIVPYLSAPAGCITLLGKTVDISSITSTSYAYIPGVEHAFTCCLRGKVLEDGYKATEVYITENPPKTHQITYWNNTFELLIYHKELNASGGNGEDYYLYATDTPFAVNLRGIQPSAKG